MPEIRDFTVAGVTVQPGETKSVTIEAGKEVVVSCWLVPAAVRNITFFRAGKTIFVQPTNAEGYMGRYWTPTSDDVGTYSYWCVTNGIYSGRLDITVTAPPEGKGRISDLTYRTKVRVGEKFKVLFRLNNDGATDRMFASYYDFDTGEENPLWEGDIAGGDYRALSFYWTFPEKRTINWELRVGHIE